MLNELLAVNVVLACAVALLLVALPCRATWGRTCAVVPLLATTAVYLYWRFRNLPAPAIALGFMWPALFFAWESLATVYESWSHFVLTRISDRSAEAEEYEIQLRASTVRPTIDVWIATYEEPIEIVEQTIRAAVGLDYPADKLRVYLLDDGQHKRDRAARLRDLCARRGAYYLARPRKPSDPVLREQINYAGKGGKAGSHRFAFDKTTGEYILQLDADFVVDPQFIYRTLGFVVYRPKTGCIQVPQRFRNPDPIAHNLLGWNAWCEAQHSFMSLTEPCRDAWGNAFCVGTGCIVPRHVIQEIGGYPHSTVSEDMEMSYAMLLHGYHTVVLNEPLAYGLAPEAVPEYLKQRIRWCRGTIQHLFIKTGPIRGQHRFLDRLFYIDGVFYWLSFVFLACLLIAPIIFWTTGIAAISGPGDEIVWILLPRLLLRAQVTYWLSLGKITPVVLTVMNSLGAFHFSGAALGTLVSPFGIGFRVTTKGETRDRVVIRWRLFLLFAAISFSLIGLMSLNLCGALNVVPVGEMTPLNVVWSLCTALVCLLCALVCIELPKPQGDIWVMREVTKTNPIETIKALGCRLVLVDVLGAHVFERVRNFGTDSTIRANCLESLFSWCLKSPEYSDVEPSDRPPAPAIQRFFFVTDALEATGHQRVSASRRFRQVGRWFCRPVAAGGDST